MIGFSDADGSPLLVALTATPSLHAPVWASADDFTRIVIDMTLSGVAPDTIYLMLLKRKSAKLSTEYQVIFQSDAIGGELDYSGIGHGRVKLPVQLEGYTFSLPIDPYHEYSIQMIKTGLGAVAAYAEISFSRPYSLQGN